LHDGLHSGRQTGSADLAAVIRIAFLIVLLLGAAIGSGAVLFAWTGIYSVGASEGHWPVTRWFLEFAMRRSVSTHALAVDRPPPFTEAMVRRGLGHFAMACAPCHGAPGEPRNEVVRNMLPPPPDLAARVPDWRPEQLFWIVKHGLKYTGMPSWPTQLRDDEVWAMVAFLERLPELDAKEYAPLARGPLLLAPPPPPDPMAPLGGLSELSRSALVTCARCHGIAGEGDPAGAFPRLAGQSRAYLLESLRSYATGRRPSGIMQPVAVELGAGEMEQLAGYFATVVPANAPSRPAPPDAALELGARVASEGVPARGVPACHACHEPGRAAANPLYPSLAGQPADYLAGQIRLWQQGVRGGTPAAEIMARLADGLRPDEIDAVAAYFSSLPPSAAASEQAFR
jgi:cytochrome c553